MASTIGPGRPAGAPATDRACIRQVDFAKASIALKLAQCTSNIFRQIVCRIFNAPSLPADGATVALHFTAAAVFKRRWVALTAACLSVSVFHLSCSGEHSIDPRSMKEGNGGRRRRRDGPSPSPLMAPSTYPAAFSSSGDFRQLDAQVAAQNLSTPTGRH
jgi:hypothetical protein